MSSWTYINGIIHVAPLGKTQVEKRYILDTVLNHLPIVNGSEGEMKVYVVQSRDYDTTYSCDEFGFVTDNLIDAYGCKSRNGWLRVQSEYILVLDGKLRDKYFKETYRELQKFLCRLAKRVTIKKILIDIQDSFSRDIIADHKPYYKMFESLSSLDEGSSNWCECLLRKYVPKCYE